MNLWLLVALVVLSGTVYGSLEGLQSWIKGDEQQGYVWKCKPGECRLCGEGKTKDDCYIAHQAGNKKIHLQLIIDHKTIVQGDVSRSCPAPLCTCQLGNDQEELCIISKNVDLTKQHLCIDVYMNLHNATRTDPDIPLVFALGCITIPRKTRPAFLDPFLRYEKLEVKLSSLEQQDDLSPFDIE